MSSIGAPGCAQAGVDVLSLLRPSVIASLNLEGAQWMASPNAFDTAFPTPRSPARAAATLIACSSRRSPTKQTSPPMKEFTAVHAWKEVHPPLRPHGDQWWCIAGQHSGAWPCVLREKPQGHRHHMGARHVARRSLLRVGYIDCWMKRQSRRTLWAARKIHDAHAEAVLKRVCRHLRATRPDSRACQP